MTDRPLISRTHFTTRDLPRRQQYEAFHNWFHPSYEGSPSLPPDQGHIFDISVYNAPTFALAKFNSLEIEVKRSMAQIRRSPIDHWTIRLALRNESALELGGASCYVPAKRPLVMSLGQEMAGLRKEDDFLLLYLPRDNFREFAPVLDSALGMVVPGTFGTLLVEYMFLLERNLGQIEVTEALRLGDAVASMVAACIAPSSDRIAAAKGQLGLGRMEQVRRVVRSEMRSPALGPDLLCRHLGMSRAALYRLMEGEGGIARYIQRQRLLESYAALSDLGNNKSVAAIAEEFSFCDPPAFSHAFKREFGVSASDVRAAARAGLRSPPASKASAGRNGSRLTDWWQGML
jgi:AraC-like DNA-binding protein